MSFARQALDHQQNPGPTSRWESESPVSTWARSRKRAGPQALQGRNGGSLRDAYETSALPGSRSIAARRL